MTAKHYRKRLVITVGAVFAAALAGLIWIGDGSAQSSTDLAAQARPDAASAFMPVLKMFSALVVVVIAIYVGVYLLRKSMGRRFSGNRINKTLEVLETTYVGPKKSVSLVRVSDRSVLIGVTDQNISLLSELDAAATAELLAQDAVADEGYSFADLFRSTSKRIQELTRRSDESVARAES